MPDRHVAIVVDSAASLPRDISRNPRLYVVPMQLNINGTTYLDGQDITPSGFYRLLRKSSTMPTTSAPSPASFLDVFHDASKTAKAILCLTVASQFSSSVHSAKNAANELKECFPDIEIHVMDSRNAAGGEGLIALEAWRAANQGRKLDEVRTAAEDVASKVRLLAMVDTLYYLWKGGRVPKIAHAGTSLLRIKPVFELFQGDVNTLARPRTRKRAIEKLVDLMRERVQSEKVHAAVMHADAPEPASELKYHVEAGFQCEEIFISEFTPVMGAHIGPGLLGVAFWCE